MAKKINPKQAAPAPQKPVTPRPASPVRSNETTDTAPKKKFSITTTLCIALALISFVVYFNTLRGGFVLDDSVVTTKNSIVMSGFKGIPELLVTPRMKGVAYFKNDNYRPLSLVMFAAEVELFGVNPAPMHFFNILFFAGCIVLLFLFFDKLFDRKKTIVALIAALLFALHPIHTEVVANIKSRDEIMCFFFAFAALNLFLDYMKKGKFLLLIAGTILMFLSLVSKETSFTLLAIIPLIFFFIRNEDRKRAIFIMAGVLVAAAVFMVIRTKVLNAFNCSTSAVEFIDNALVRANGMERFATPILILGKYLYLLIIPYPLNNDYCFNSIPYVGFGNIWVLLSLTIYVGMAVVAGIRFFKKHDDPWAFAIIFYLVTLSLFSNIPFLIGAEMGERFLFYASVGFCLAAGLAIEKWIIKKEMPLPEYLKYTPLLAVMVPVCLAFTGLTVSRNADWKDNYTLFKTDLEKAPNDSRLNFYLGDELAENIFPAEKDPVKQKEIITESIRLLNRSLAIFPEFTDAHTEAGKAHFLANNYDSAIYHYTTAIAQSPYQSIAANNLGTVYLRQQRYREAIGAYLLALKINPGFVQAFYNLGCCYVQTHQYDSAIIALEKTLAMAPGYAEAYMQIGMAYFQDKKFDKAEPYFKKALDINPNDVNAINNLGAVYLNSGKIQQAMEVFKKAIAISPGYVNGYSNLGHCYYELKQYQACIDVITKALQLDPKDVKDIPYLALCYKGLGNMPEALKYEAIAKQYYSNFKL